MWFLCPRWDCDAVGNGAADPLSGSLWCPLFDSCLEVCGPDLLFSQFLVPDTSENLRFGEGNERVSTEDSPDFKKNFVGKKEAGHRVH